MAESSRERKLVVVGRPGEASPSVPVMIRARAEGVPFSWDGHWWKIVDLLGPRPPERLHTVAYLELVEGPKRG